MVYQLPVCRGVPVSSMPPSSLPVRGASDSGAPASGALVSSKTTTAVATQGSTVRGEGPGSVAATTSGPVVSQSVPTAPPMVASVAPSDSTPVVTSEVLPTSANMLPPIPPYHGGEQKDGETLQDWLEHFEAVSQLVRWDDHYRLVYLTAALRGTAKSFYRSCSVTQRSNYAGLVAELRKRFTPVHLTAVQTQHFHDRRQRPEETADEFTQDLRKLYSKAYSECTRGTLEAEKVGQTVLASQFVAGLHPCLQAKVVGMEGGMDQLVL